MSNSRSLLQVHSSTIVNCVLSILYTFVHTSKTVVTKLKVWYCCLEHGSSNKKPADSMKISGALSMRYTSTIVSIRLFIL